jgi:putative lipoprotein
MFLMRKDALESPVLTIVAFASLSLLPIFARAQQSSLTQNPDAPPTQPARQLPVPQSGRVSRSPMRFALPRRQYLCADDVRITILVEPKAVRLMLNEHIYNLNQIESSSGENSGTKYSDGTIVWFTDGADEKNGSLQDATDPANHKALATDCHLQSTYPPVSSATGTVTGTLSLKQKRPLPATAAVIVELQDVTLADAPATTIAEYKTTVGKQHIPIPFILSFESAKIDPKHTYSVEARILIKNELGFTNDASYPVLTQGNPAKADLVLIPVGSSATSKP